MGEKYLPVGTVVMLKDAAKSIMITGFCAISAEDSKMYDYCACLYPEGVVGPEMNLLFDHDQISKILYNGYVSDEERNFKKKLNEIIAQQMANGELPGVDNNVTSNNLMNGNTVNQPQMFNQNFNV